MSQLPDASKAPPQFWRTLEERDARAGEPSRAAQSQLMTPDVSSSLGLGPDLGTSRRGFLQILGASLALAESGCLRRPAETIVPYAQAPEKIVPGRPLYYATAVTLGGYAMGVVVETHEGRPTKVEGNPDHPASLGATDLFAQAQLLSLYDPDRSQCVLSQGKPASFASFLAVVKRELERLSSVAGEGLRLLTESVSSPTLAAQLGELQARHPRARWHQYEPVHQDCQRAGTALAFGRALEVRPRFDQAQLVVSLGADFLGRGPGWVRDARQFIDRRRVAAGRGDMSRLFVAESALSITGSQADHRLALHPRDLLHLTRRLAAALLNIPSACAAPHDANELVAAWVPWLVQELSRHRGASLILAGDEQPPAVHALAGALNHALGNIGRTVDYIEPVQAGAGSAAGQTASLRELAQDMDAGRVSALIVLGGNPVYHAPADLDFARRLQKVPLRIHLGQYVDETARLCHWHIPEAHPFESWSDARASDGTASLIQPLIAPLYGGHSVHELMALLLGHEERSPHELVRAFWRAQQGSPDFERQWAQALQRGVIPDTALPPQAVELHPEGVKEALRACAPEASGVVVLFQPDPTIWDGRFANSGWLQELPKPLCTLTWENAAQLGPDTARRLGLATGDVIELRYRERTLMAPVLCRPGQAEDTVVLPFGYGRTAAGQVGSGLGFSAFALRTSDEPWVATQVTLRKSGQQRQLALTQRHHTMQGRDPVRVCTHADYLNDPRAAHAGHEDAHAGPTLFAPHPTTEGHRWGMAIDLTACIGCGGCTLACQAENNIPVVGKKEVLAGRAMHWIRVDHYHRDSDSRSLEVVHQPVPCMHCETAPCELVCPVEATVHDHEGLNDMVYNRCVGTRYCSNNCPYKVRRFNFFHYSEPRAPSLRLLQNPDVTVRSRGVMEKCTYCVQRINAVRIRAELAERPIRDGEIVPACAQACPTQAIVFGDLNDPQSRVRQLKESPLDYALLGELNTRPRTTYQARVTNPEPGSPASAKREP